jgi:hypothetical protein
VLGIAREIAFGDDVFRQEPSNPRTEQRVVAALTQSLIYSVGQGVRRMSSSTGTGNYPLALRSRAETPRYRCS